MLIGNLNDLLEISLPHEAASTVGGLIMTHLGRVPQMGDTVEIEGIRLRVEAVAHHSVTAACITLPPGAPALDSQEVA
jgi:CBS domain containing-hemolysin-like protein